MRLTPQFANNYRDRVKRLATRVPAMPSAGSVLFVLFLGGIAIFAGLASVILPWWFVLAFVGLVISLLVPLRYPFAGLILTIFFIFNVIPARFFPELPFLGGKLKIFDVMLMYLAVIMFATAIVRRRRFREIFGPAFWPLVYVLGFVAVSAVYGKVVMRNLNAIAEARNHIGWLIIPVTLLCVDTPQRFKHLLRALIFASVIIAIYLLLQSLFQIQIMGGRVELLDLSENSDITRSTAGGGVYLIAFSLFYCLLMPQARRMPWWLTLPISIVLLAGLAVTFGRGVWIATAIGLVFASFLYRGLLGGMITAIAGTLVLALLVLGMSVAKPRMVEALVDRVTSVGEEIRSGGSFHHREVENSEALRSIRRKPILGVGVGGDYKQVASSVGAFENETSYIHNGYLYYPLKMGILAAGIPFAFMLAFASIFWHWLPSLRGADRALPAAIAGAFLVPMITSFTQPEWATITGISVISLFFAIAWLSKRLHDGTDLAKAATSRSVRR